MTPTQALDNLYGASRTVSANADTHDALAASRQILAAIIAAHEAKAKADAEHSAP